MAEVDDGLDDFAEEDLLKRGGTCPEYAYPFGNTMPITSPFGYRTHPILRTRRLHAGTDFGAPQGTPLLAVADGIVTLFRARGPMIGYGNYVDLRQSGGNRDLIRYAHLSRFSDNLKSGSTVRQGDVIGYVGSTGFSTGPHLHLEFRKGPNDSPFDPMGVLRAKPGDHLNCGTQPAELDWRYPAGSRDIELRAKFFGNSGVARVRFYTHRDNLRRSNPNGMVEICADSRGRTCRLSLQQLSSHKRSNTSGPSSAAGIHVEVQGHNAAGHMVARGFAVVPDPSAESLESGRFYLRRRLADSTAKDHAFEIGVERTPNRGRPPLSVCATVGSDKEKCWPLAHSNGAPTEFLGNLTERAYLRASLTTLESRVFRVTDRENHRRPCRRHSPPFCQQSAVFLK